MLCFLYCVKAATCHAQNCSLTNSKNSFVISNRHVRSANSWAPLARYHCEDCCGHGGGGNGGDRGGDSFLGMEAKGDGDDRKLDLKKVKNY